MIRAVPLLALALAGCSPPVARGAGGGPGGKIVSTNPCADAILIDLVAPDRIAAISRYSKNPAASSIAAETAARFPATAGTAEEVIALRPSLVLTSSFTPLATRVAYEQAGLKTLVLDSPVTIEASRAQVMRIADAVGAVARGRALNARIDAALASALRSTPANARAQLRNGRGEDVRSITSDIPTGSRPSPGWEKPQALLFVSGDLVTGGGTLLDELLTRTGFRNAAASYGLNSTGTLTIETIANRPPDVILTPDAQSRTATLRRRVLQRMNAKTIDARFARNLVNCGGPTIIPAVARLAAIRRSL